MESNFTIMSGPSGSSTIVIGAFLNSFDDVNYYDVREIKPNDIEVVNFVSNNYNFKIYRSIIDKKIKKYSNGLRIKNPLYYKK